MHVLFCHGLESGPVGTKSTALGEAGHEVTAPDCRGLILQDRVVRIAQALERFPPTGVVVGSSFGGLAAVCALLRAAPDHRPRGLVLCAPALEIQQPPATTLELRPVVPTIIVHGTRDNVIPIPVSQRFASAHGCELVETDDDHRLANSLPEILDAVQRVGT